VPPPCKDISSHKTFFEQALIFHQRAPTTNRREYYKSCRIPPKGSKISNPVAFSTKPQREARSKIDSFRLNHGHFEGFKVLIVSGCKKCVSLAPF